ncbi:MAG: hypothetical protein OZ921_20190 [Sorangiineae bacterium]|nr:hypothetical protein [Polyangiaceae bacterium]MEB2324846.1 hypothetical protein [Sorangiineae bacterium]
MTAAARGLSLLDFLVEWIAERLGEPIADEPSTGVAPLPESELAPFRAFLALARPVADAPDHRALRQACGTLALSADYLRAMTRLLAAAPEPAADQAAIPRDELAKRLARHVAGPAASLLAEAFSLAWDVFVWQRGHDAVPAPADFPAPELIADLRRRLVLGDEVPARVAEVVLASLRGEVALLTAIAMLSVRERLDTWKAIGLGELAVNGIKASKRLVLPTLDRIDLDGEIQQYAAYKRDLVLRLESRAQD